MNPLMNPKPGFTLTGSARGDLILFLALLSLAVFLQVR